MECTVASTESVCIAIPERKTKQQLHRTVFTVDQPIRVVIICASFVCLVFSTLFLGVRISKISRIIAVWFEKQKNQSKKRTNRNGHATFKFWRLLTGRQTNLTWIHATTRKKNVFKNKSQQLENSFHFLFEFFSNATEHTSPSQWIGCVRVCE